MWSLESNLTLTYHLGRLGSLPDGRGLNWYKENVYAVTWRGYASPHQPILCQSIRLVRDCHSLLRALVASMFTSGIALVGLAAMIPGALAAPTAPGCDGPDSRVYPPTGAVVIDASGAHSGSYKTISAGVAALKDQTAEQTVFILPGTYNEQVLVSPMQGPLVLQGYTCDSSSYAANEVTITSGLAQKDIPDNVTGEARNDLTSTLRLKSDNIRVYNLNVVNTAGNVGQALAVNVNATNNGFYGVNFTGEKMNPKPAPGQLQKIRADPPGRLPGHHPQRQGTPALRQLLHQRRHRLHLWPLRPVLVRGLRHRVGRSGVHHRQRARVRRQLRLLRLQQGRGQGHGRRGLDVPGPALAPVRPRRLPEQRPGRCRQPRGVG